MFPNSRRNNQVNSEVSGRGSRWLPPGPTVYILVIGIAGGLVVVIAVVLLCKCCIQKEKELRRKLYSLRRQRHCLGHYVSLDCTSSRDCDEENNRRTRRHSASSVDSSTVEQSLADDNNLDLENEIDFVVAKYKETIQVETVLDAFDDDDDTEVPTCAGARGHATTAPAAALADPSSTPAAGAGALASEQNSEAERDDSSSNLTTDPEGLPAGAGAAGAGTEKHVSFLLTEKAGSFGGYGGGGISKPHRITGGDYHQLKHSKIDRHFAFHRGFRPASLGAAPPSSLHSAPLNGGCEAGSALTSVSDPLVLGPSTKDKKPSAGKHHHPPPSGCHRTEVVVDVHPGPRTEGQPMEGGGGGGQAPKTIRGPPPTQSPAAAAVAGGKQQQTLVVPGKGSAVGESGGGGPGSAAQRQSMSLEMPSLQERSSPHQTRRVRSYEENRAATAAIQLDYDRNKITQFIRKPLFNNDPTDEKESPASRSKVRYNDTGSFEEIDEDKETDNNKAFENKRFPVYEKKKLQVLKETDNEEVKDEGGSSGGGGGGGGGRAVENYQEIWTLRATFEEEEEGKGDEGGEGRAEDTSSEDSQPPPQPPPMEIDGNHRMVEEDDRPGVYHKKHPGVVRPQSSGLVVPGRSLLFPDSYSRRQTYRNVIARRMCRIEAPPVDVTVRVPPPPSSSPSSSSSAQQGHVVNSFDSAETQETDGEISDASRHDLTTTSFESTTTTTTTTTENTDSTGDGGGGGGGGAGGHSKGRGGIRGDSGYKSLEGQQSLTGMRAAATTPAGGGPAANVLAPPSAAVAVVVPPLAPAATLSPFSSLSKIPEVTSQEVAGERRTPRGGGGGGAPLPPPPPPPPHRPTPGVRSGGSAPFDRRSSKTASKKRRDYRSERHVAAYDSIGLGGGDPGRLCSSAAEHSGDSFEDCPPPSPLPASPSQRLSVFPRFLRSQGAGSHHHRRPPPRDYSVDEKTDALFNEFLRYDPNLDRKSSFRSFPGFHRWQRVHCSSTGGAGAGGGTGGHHHHHHHLHGDGSLDACFKRRHLRLTGNLRTSAFDGAAVSFHRISPQDSIEEELSGSAAGTTEVFSGRERQDVEQSSVTTNSN